MIRSFKIKAEKDENGLYILPNDIKHRDEVLCNLRYHEREMNPHKNLMFAIIWTINNDKLRDTDINGYTHIYVRINNVPLYFSRFFLDKEEDTLYETETDNELVMLKRKLKLKKLKK